MPWKVRIYCSVITYQSLINNSHFLFFIFRFLETRTTLSCFIHIFFLKKPKTILGTSSKNKLNIEKECLQSHQKSWKSESLDISGFVCLISVNGFCVFLSPEFPVNQMMPTWKEVRAQCSEHHFFPGQEEDSGTPSSRSLLSRDWQLINCSVQHLENQIMIYFAIISHGKLPLKSFSKISTFLEMPPSVVKSTCLPY